MRAGREKKSHSKAVILCPGREERSFPWSIKGKEMKSRQSRDCNGAKSAYTARERGNRTAKDQNPTTLCTGKWRIRDGRENQKEI